MTRQAFVIALVVAFIAGCAGGVVSGVLLVRMMTPHGAFADTRGPGGPGAPDTSRAHRTLVQRLDDALDLTPAQHERIDTLYVRSRRRQMATRDSLRVAIEHELTPQQLERWHQIEAQFPRSSRRGGPPPPPPGGRP